MEITDPVSVTPVPPTIPQKQQHHPRRVRFQDRQVEEATAASFSQSYDEGNCSLWYTDNEIAAFRTDARLLCRELRASNNSVQSGEEGGSIRGLEFRTSLARQERKQMTIRCIVKAQHRATSSQQLARVYRKCSKWSRIMSLTVAHNDFCSAYNLGTSQPLPAMLEYPLPFRSKYSTCKRRVNQSAAARKSVIRSSTGNCCTHVQSEAHHQVPSRMGIA